MEVPEEQSAAGTSAAGTSSEMQDESASAAGTSADTSDETLLSQVRLDGLNKWATKKELVHRLEQHLSIGGIRRIKKQHEQDYAFVYFESSAARFTAEKLLAGHVWKGREISVVQARPLDPERFNKRQRDTASRVDGGDGGAGEDRDGKRSRTHDGGEREEGRGAAAEGKKLRSASDVVTAYHTVEYAEQLRRKRRDVFDALRKLPNEMKRTAKSVAEAQRDPWRRIPWMHPAQLKANGGSPCPLEDVIPAALMSGYRNKCEFSFGVDEHNVPCLGFQLGRISLVGPVVGPPDACPNVSDEMKEVVRRVQALLLDSPLPPYNKVERTGFWRQLLVRQAFNPAPTPAEGAEGAGAGGSGDGDSGGDGGSEVVTAPDAGGTPMLLVFQVQASAASAETLAAERERLLSALTAAPHTIPMRLSVAIQPCDGPGEAIASEQLEWLCGPPYVEEQLLGLRYRVSPAAFFQVNTPGAEQLCNLLRKLCDAGPETVLFDVCCGTGTLGLSLASAVKRVIGIELCKPAVLDARANAARNGVANASFVVGKAEDATRRQLDLLSEAEKQSVVAIVDPPRAGLHHEVCKALRSCLALRRLVFVACHAPSFVNNAVPLCRPTSTSFQGPPFVPKRAFALDLFPHTPHCELIVLLEREEQAEPTPTPTDDAPATVDADASAAAVALAADGDTADEAPAAD